MISLGVKDIVDILIIALLLFYVYKLMKTAALSAFFMACWCFWLCG